MLGPSMMTILCLRCEERKPGAGGKVVMRWSSLRRFPGLLGCDVSGYDGEIPVSLFTGINVDAATRGVKDLTLQFRTAISASPPKVGVRSVHLDVGQGPLADSCAAPKGRGNPSLI